LTDFPSPGGLFLPLSPLLEGIPFAPDLAALDGLSVMADVRTQHGLPLRFVLPQDDGLGYEARIWARGEVETRPDNWHDFFNALVWLTFPQSKATLNHRHMQEGGGQQDVRGRRRDAMTHFDECGVVVLSSDSSLLDLVRSFHWKELFWARRADLAGALRCFIFGHATYEQLLSPFRGLTAKAVLYEVAEDWLQQPLSLQLADVDRRLAGELAAGAYADPRDLHPLPLMGFPGVTAENENAAYYDDTWQFRPGRRQK
jgi:hypothetical protein